MSIFFPDNDNRRTRLIELSTETQGYLYDATSKYQSFQKLSKTVNGQIKNLYQESGLQPPKTKTIDVIKAADPSSEIHTEETWVEIAEIIVDIAGFAGSLKYLAPAATRLLVRAGAISAETAAKSLVKFTVPLIGREVEITAGDLAGGLLGGIVGGGVIAGIDLGIDAIEGRIARDKLRKGINQIYPMRTTTKIAVDQTDELHSSLQSVKTTMDALTGAGVPLTDQMIKNLIKKDVQPSLDRMKAITNDTVISELRAMDREHHSWTNEDPSS